MPESAERRRRHFNLVPVVGIILGIGGLMLAVGGHLLQYEGTFSWRQLEIDFYANAGTELISIAITVVVIDTLYQFRERRQYKARLIRELGSGDRGTALRAVQELKEENWFYDGTLKGAELWRADLSLGQLWFANLKDADLRAVNLREAELKGANLRHARLNHADLRGAELADADLTGASLRGAQLQGSNMSVAQIQSAKTLAGAIMPDGSPYDVWVKRSVPATLTERKVELDPILTANATNSAITVGGKQSMPLLWFGMGVATAVLGHLLLELFRKR